MVLLLYYEQIKSTPMTNVPSSCKRFFLFIRFTFSSINCFFLDIQFFLFSESEIVEDNFFQWKKVSDVFFLLFWENEGNFQLFEKKPYEILFLFLFRETNNIFFLHYPIFSFIKRQCFRFRATRGDFCVFDLCNPCVPRTSDWMIKIHKNPYFCFLRIFVQKPWWISTIEKREEGNKNIGHCMCYQSEKIKHNIN